MPTRRQFLRPTAAVSLTAGLLPGCAAAEDLSTQEAPGARAAGAMERQELGQTELKDTTLVGWWKLDEKSGTTVHDSSGTAPPGNLRRIADGRNRFSLSLPQAKRRFVVPNYNNQFNQINHLRTFMANLG